MMTNFSFGSSLAGLDGQLAHDEVHVWLANLELEEGTIKRLGLLLNPAEQERAERFEVARARKQFVVSRGFLRIVLGKYLGIDAGQVKFRLASHGKPELAENRTIHFNLSHTESLAAIAVTRTGAVGIDVEKIRGDADVLELAERFFSKQEAAWVRSQPERERSSCFFSCWTAKEAYVKAHGAGLSIPLDGFAVIPDVKTLKLQLEVFGEVSEARRWSMWRLELPTEFRGAVAVEHANSRVRMGWLSATEL